MVEKSMEFIGHIMKRTSSFLIIVTICGMVYIACKPEIFRVIIKASDYNEERVLTTLEIVLIIQGLIFILVLWSIYYRNNRKVTAIILCLFCYKSLIPVIAIINNYYGAEILFDKYGVQVVRLWSYEELAEYAKYWILENNYIIENRYIEEVISNSRTKAELREGLYYMHDQINLYSLAHMAWFKYQELKTYLYSFTIVRMYVSYVAVSVLYMMVESVVVQVGAWILRRWYGFH